MGLIKKLFSMFGLGGSRSGTRRGADQRRQDVDMTVEREPDEPEPATESEDAVKGTGDADQTAAAETATETADETGQGADTTDADTAEPEAEADTADTGAEADTAGDADDTEGAASADLPNADESVDTIKGIGPSYAERLGDAGIETVGELVDAGAASIAADTDLSEKRVSRWIDRARGKE